MTVLAVDELTVRTPDELLLNDISLAIDTAETVLLAGPSGSGKTLLGSAIAGLLSERGTLSTAGAISRDGSVGMCLQNPRTQLVRERVRADVAFGLENRGVDPARIADRIDAWAERLDATHLLDRRVGTLSRGETTIVALLGTLVTEPDLVVLDEPLAALDASNRRLVLETIDTLQGRTSLLVAEQDTTGLLGLADRVVLLEDGQITARGRPRAVAGSIREAGLAIPFGTAVALARGHSPESIPLSEGSP